jgi:UDP-N-acetylmuramoylalanine--D-glutamate ligase
VTEGTLTDDTDGREAPVLDLRNVPSLPGRHNWQNAAAAYAACKTQGVQPPVIVACMSNFPGLPHRQELVAVIDGIAYVNDSKATNAEAAAMALACYDTVYWIAGGRAKETGLAGLEPLYPRIARAFLIGEAEESFAAALEGRVQVSRCGDLPRAVAEAQAAARAGQGPGIVVLLSPAAASFDQFENFEQRGERFRALVQDLPGEHADLDPGGRVLQ